MFLKKSVIWTYLLLFCGRVQRRVRNASLTVRLRQGYGILEQSFSKGIFSPLCDRGYDRSGYQYRLRQAGMRSREESLILSLLERVKEYLLDTRVASFGWLFLLTGIFFLTEARLSGGRGEIGFLLLLCSFPLCASGRSLASALRRSFFFSKLFVDFCGFSPDGLAGRERGKGRNGLALVLSLSLALFVRFISPTRCVIGCFVLACIGLLFALPELNLLLFVLVFPFLQLLPHPSVILAAFVLVTELSFFAKVLWGKREFFFSLCDFLVLLFCFSLFLGGVFGSGDWKEGVLLSFLAGIYFPATHLLENRQWRRRCRTWAVFSAGISACIGILQYALGRAEIKWVDASRFGDIGGRVTSVFDNPNILAIYLLLIFPLSLCGAFDVRESLSRRLRFGAFGGAILLCLILTWSRGAWLALLAVVVLFLLFHSRRSMALLCLLPLPLSGVCSFLPAPVLGRFLSIGDLAESSVRYRVFTWQGVLRMIREHPFGIGVGSKAFSSVYPDYAVSGTETVMHAHHVLLEITAEIGIAGAVLFCLLLALFLLRTVKTGEDSGAVLAVVGAMIMGMFDHLWYSPGLIALFFFILAMMKTAKGERIWEWKAEHRSV